MNAPTDPIRIAALRADLVSRFADDAAHEIRNPLNAMVINLAVLRGRVASGDQAAALNRIDVLESEVRRVHGIIERLVALLRPPGSSDRSADLAATMDDIMPLIALRAAARRIAFTPLAVSAGIAIGMPRAMLRYVVLDAAMTVLDHVADDGALEFALTSSPLRLTLYGTPASTEPAAEPVAALARDLLHAAAGSVRPDPDATADTVSLALTLPTPA